MAAAETLRAPVRPMALFPAAAPAAVEMELSDDELDGVVGGLERAYTLGAGLAPEPEPHVR